MDKLPDQEFVITLRAAVDAYLGAVDRWESAYRRYYRLPGHELTISSDMAAEQREYETRRRSLELLLPRARRLCLRHRVQDPFPGLLHSSLGGQASQQRTGSAVGRSERSRVAGCLVELADSSSEWTRDEGSGGSVPRASGRWERRAILGGIGAVVGAIAMVIATRPTRKQRPRTDRHPTVASPGASGTAGTEPRFYTLSGRPLTRWGDYGDILQHGMTAHLARSGNLLSLERAGPYMPPITFPGMGDVVLNAAGRKLLETSGLTGFTFQPVIKTRIVEIHWHDWDLTANEPREYPESGEPEDYILQRPPNARVAEELGDTWELVVPVTAKIGRARRIVDSFHELWVERNSWRGEDVFRGNGYGSLLLTERAKVWMEEYLGGYVQFEAFASR